MPDQPSPYRFWGSVKPPETREPIRATVTPKTSDSGKTATIRLYDPIDSWGEYWGVSAKEFAAALDGLDDVTDIQLLINSPGGETFEAIAIVNLLRAHPANVTATVEGLAASAASFIAASADTTVMAPNSQMMVHDSWGLVVGPAEDMHAYGDVLDKLSDNMAALYAAAAGGTADEWRAVMKAETWYTADEAVTAGLAQSIAKPKPSDAAAAKALSRFDLTIFNHAGRADAPDPLLPAAKADPHTPAEPPVTTTPKEADAMSDTVIKGLRERLGIAEDVEMDDEAVLAEYDKQATAAAELLAAAPAKTEPAKADEPTIPEGMTLVSETLLATLQEGAAAGIAARAKQNGEDRDKAIEAAFAAGKISASAKADWSKAWDLRPEQTAKELASLGVRFPVAKATGYGGSDGSDGEGAKPFDDDEAAAMAELTGAPKEAFLV